MNSKIVSEQPTPATISASNTEVENGANGKDAVKVQSVRQTSVSPMEEAEDVHSVTVPKERQLEVCALDTEAAEDALSKVVAAWPKPAVQSA